MPTITPVHAGAGASPAYFGGDRQVVSDLHTVLFDSSYPTGGESIATQCAAFKEVLAVFVQGPASRLYAVDLTSGAEKILLYTALSTEASNASDQSSITVRIRILGYK